MLIAELDSAGAKVGKRATHSKSRRWIYEQFDTAKMGHDRDDWKSADILQ